MYALIDFHGPHDELKIQRKSGSAMVQLLEFVRATMLLGCAAIVLMSLQTYLATAAGRSGKWLDPTELFTDRTEWRIQMTNKTDVYDALTIENYMKGQSVVMPMPFTNRNHTLCPKSRKLQVVDDILCMSQLKFDAGYKNPCWQSEVQGGLYCLPYFMLIGMDKSGTTDLFDRIVKHPEVIGNRGILGKETQYWSWKRYGFHYLTDTANRASLDDYTRVFDTAAEKIENSTDIRGYHRMITGDGTPMDLWDFGGWKQIPQNARLREPKVLTPHLIRHVLPEVKLIVILRNPVDRLYSDYFFTENRERVKNPKTFHSAVQRAITALNNCTESNTLRSCLYNRTLHKQFGNKMTRVHLGFYSVFLTEWFNVFPRKSFLILSNEEYATDTTIVIQKVFEFLGLAQLSSKEMKELGIDSAKRKFQTRAKRKAKPMEPETRKLLVKLYEPYNKQLKTLLTNKKFDWAK